MLALRRILAPASAAALAILTVTTLQAPASAAPLQAPASAAPNPAIVAGPAGVGELCTPAQPCSVVTALGRARGGDRVELLGGSYGALDLHGVGGTATARIIVEPSPGATVTFERLHTYVPNVQWRGLTVTRSLYVYPPAPGTTITGFHLAGATAILRGDGTVLRDSRLEAGRDVDAVQIKNGTGITLEGNTVRGYSSTPGNSTHVDCVQVYDASGVRILRNTLSNCSNAGIILSPGAGAGIAGVTIQGNFVQGCTPVTTTCRGGSAMDLREPSATSVVVRNNTIVDGSVRLGAGVAFDRNVVTYLDSCSAPVTNSVIAAWPTFSCQRPSWLGAAGNRQGEAVFADRAAADLRILDPASVEIVPVETFASPAIGFDGTPVDLRHAGADDGLGHARPDAPAPTGPAPVAPVPAVQAQPVYRFWNPAYRAHFYTISPTERDRVRRGEAGAWRYEGEAYRAFESEVPGSVPLYRFWSSAYRGHFYTTNKAERDHVIASYPTRVWRYEGIAYYVYPVSASVPGTSTVARFWSASYRHHFYTASATEAAHVKRHYPQRVWKYEFDAFRVRPAS